MGIFNISDPIGKPIRFTIPLSFLPEDVEQYQWLSEGDRYYLPEKPLGQGGHSTAFLGHPCHPDGNPIADTNPVVIKIPKLAANKTSTAVAGRLNYIQAQTITEWALVRKKLRGCKHANPIFDLGSVWVDDPLTEMTVSVQPFLSNAVSLKQWLVKRQWRQKISHDARGNEIHDWTGLSQWDDWFKLAQLVSEALLDVHQRRVTHGDVWPPNIFIADTEPPYAILIDFGESFGVVPSSEPRLQRNHPYRAPERSASEYVPTQQIDVYSFGKLLLYLAIGRDEEIPRFVSGDLLYGHRRRSYVRNLLFNYGNYNLVTENPELLDLIAQCSSFDPVDRPTMIEVADQLRRLESPARGGDPISRLMLVASEVTSRAPQMSNIFKRFIDKKIDELERVIKSCETEMVEITGSRDVLINALVTLFEELNTGDSWTTLTTPAVWQRSALGLDGRYATATVKAVRRGASVHRAYTISIEELGPQWALRFATALEKTDDANIVRLAEVFRMAVAEFEYQATAQKYKLRSDSDPVICAHQERFVSVLQSLAEMKRHCNISHLMHVDSFGSIEQTKGLYLGLMPVAGSTKKREVHTKHPASLMFLGKEPVQHDRWLLVMTDIRGRNEYETNPAWPQLLGVKVYKSVMGYPRNRVVEIEELLRQTFNIGALVERLAECAGNVGLS